MRRKWLLGIGIIGMWLLGSAWAAVENVKVGGDLTMYGVVRQDFDLNADQTNDDISVLATTTELKFDVDLTEEIAAVAVVRDERILGREAQTYFSQGYVSLKNLLGYGLTLKIGLQPVVLGGGLLLADPDTNQKDTSGGPFESSLIGDLAPQDSFEAIVGVFDISPATLTLAYGKGSEGCVDKDDDLNVYVGSFGYNFGNNIKGELYFVCKDTQKKYTGKDDVNNIGLRVEGSPTDTITFNGEYCYQFAKETGVREDERRRSDWALFSGVKYSFLDLTGAPSIGIDYTRLSAHWDPMFEGLTPANIANALFPNKNMQVIGLNFSAVPVEDLSLQLRYANLRAVEKFPSNWKYGNSYSTTYKMTSSKKLGDEVDLALVYDYTEDVQIGLCVDYFLPGKAFHSDNDKKAFQTLGSVKVSF